MNDSTNAFDLTGIELSLKNCPDQYEGRIGNICDACNRSISAGEAVLLNACNPIMSDKWEIDRVYCSRHVHDEEYLLFEGTDGYDEVIARGTYHTTHPADGRPLKHVRDLTIETRSEP